jgi:hypothetical protein
MTEGGIVTLRLDVGGDDLSSCDWMANRSRGLPN